MFQKSFRESRNQNQRLNNSCLPCSDSCYTEKHICCPIMHKGRFIIYVQGGREKRRVGSIRLAGGGADVFKQSIGGNLFF